jgi:hypothetical protein
MIHYIEELSAELRVDPLADAGGLQNREVESLEIGTLDRYFVPRCHKSWQQLVGKRSAFQGSTQ